MKHPSHAFALLLSTATFVASGYAQAQGRAVESSYSTKSNPEEAASYEVEFSDDPLDALPTSTYIAQIRVASSRVRVLLIRPRTSFVKEMLTSVERL